MDDTTHFLKVDAAPKRSRLTLFVLCLAVLGAQVDTAVVNLAIRPIGVYFDAGISSLQWTIDSYNLAYAALLLTGGLLADLYGRRRIFMAGAAMFTAASLICALAPNIATLIAARAFAGLGAALLLPASLAVVRVVWTTPTERGRALGVWAGCNGLALAIAPGVGGLLVTAFGWRSIFFVVLPISMAALVLAIPAMPESSDPQGRHFDGAAQISGALALGGITLAAIEAGEAFGLAMAALAVAAIAFACFIITERRRGPEALVPLDMFRLPVFLGAVIATTGMTFGMYGVLFLLPLTWQSTGVLNATEAGLALMPMALVFVAVSPLSGWLEQRLGSRAITSGGVAVIGAGLLAIGAGSTSYPIWPAEAGLMLTGLGMGLATGPLMGAAIGSVTAARAGTASALINTARMIGAAIGVAMLGAVYASMGGGFGALRIAMLIGAAAQLAAASIAWRKGGNAPS